MLLVQNPSLSSAVLLAECHTMSACLVYHNAPLFPVILFQFLSATFCVATPRISGANLCQPCRRVPAHPSSPWGCPAGLDVPKLTIPAEDLPFVLGGLPTSTRTVKQLKLPAQESTLFALKGGEKKNLEKRTFGRPRKIKPTYQAAEQWLT